MKTELYADARLSITMIQTRSIAFVPGDVSPGTLPRVSSRSVVTTRARAPDCVSRCVITIARTVLHVSRLYTYVRARALTDLLDIYLQ